MNFNGGMNLYSNGDIMWSNPAIFKFSCGLELQYFPFDTQVCQLIFASWSYDGKKIDLKTAAVTIGECLSLVLFNQM